MSYAAYNFGVRKALRDFGFVKEAEEVVDPETGEMLPEDPEAEAAMEAALEEAAMQEEMEEEEAIQAALEEEAEATGNPFLAMSDEEVVAYLQSLPEEVLEQVLARLQGDAMMEAPAEGDLE